MSDRALEVDGNSFLSFGNLGGEGNSFVSFGNLGGEGKSGSSSGEVRGLEFLFSVAGFLDTGGGMPGFLATQGPLLFRSRWEVGSGGVGGVS